MAHPACHVHLLTSLWVAQMAWLCLTLRPSRGSRPYLGSWWQTAPEVRFWPRSDLSMGGPVSSCHLTKVAKVSWRAEEAWSVMPGPGHPHWSGQGQRLFPSPQGSVSSGGVWEGWGGKEGMWSLPLKGPSTRPGQVELVWDQGLAGEGGRACPHRAVLPLGLDAARVVVLDAAARVSLQVSLPQHQLLDLPVLPEARRELGPQVDQVNLGKGKGGEGESEFEPQTWEGSITAPLPRRIFP